MPWQLLPLLACSTILFGAYILWHCARLLSFGRAMCVSIYSYDKLIELYITSPIVLQ